MNKIGISKASNSKADKALKTDGWKIIHLWECDLKPAKVGKKLNSMLRKLYS